jgi:hypothetical protein
MVVDLSELRLFSVLSLGEAVKDRRR